MTYRQRPEPDVAALAREAVEDRAADHAPRFDMAKPVDWHAVAEYERARNREALAVARELREVEQEIGTNLSLDHGVNLRMWADRLDGGQS